MPHLCYIYSKAFDMAKAKMCAYPQYDHALPHCKCTLRYCADFPCINLPDQEKYNHYSDRTPSIRFHIYHILARCTDYVKIPMEDKKICHMCKQESSPENNYLLWIY